jgi:hypothetical protein
MFYKINKILWIALAISFPLLIFSYLRVNLGFLTISIPTLIMILLLINHFLLKLANRNYILPSLKNFKGLFIVCYIFLLFHLFSGITSYLQLSAIKEIFKLFIGLIALYTFVICYPKSISFNNNFIIILCISSSILLLLLIYQYAFVFKVPYMGNNIYEAHRGGKNQLTYYIASIFPLTLLYLRTSKNKLVPIIVLWIFIFALILSSSRSAWVATIIGLIFYYIHNISITKKKLQLISKYLIGLSSMASMMVYLFYNYFDVNFEVLYRLLSIVAPDLIPDEFSYLGKHSYETRGSTIKLALSSFADYPFFGVGLSNTVFFTNRGWAHNDHIGVLLQLGILGYLAFVFIWVYLWKSITKIRNYNFKYSEYYELASKQIFITILFLSFFIDVYTSTHFWFIIGIIILPQLTINNINS